MNDDNDKKQGGSEDSLEDGVESSDEEDYSKISVGFVNGDNDSHVLEE